jgi:two-component system LytT family response regulator
VNSYAFFKAINPKNFVMLKKQKLFSTDIMYLKADTNYTDFFLKDGRKVTSSFTLKHHQADERLKDFLRVNKSYLVNRNYINECRTIQREIMIYLINGDEIKVSRRRRLDIKQQLEISRSKF